MTAAKPIFRAKQSSDKTSRTLGIYPKASSAAIGLTPYTELHSPVLIWRDDKPEVVRFIPLPDWP